MIGRTISHYRVTAELGRGGMGVVYKATDTKLERTVALKFLAEHALEDPEHKARFVREAKAAARLDHQNICPIYEIDEVDGQMFLAMAYLEGQTLKDKIAERPLKLDEALDIAIQTAQGLKAAHQKEIVHRDIKPANLMLTEDGPVKIMDFGLAQLAEQSRLTKTATMLGTPAYMSPEQAQRLPTDRRTDIWSLGVVIYEMVTGRLPFEGERQEAVLYAIAQEDPEPITALRVGVPTELDFIVSKAMAKDAGERYQHVEEMIVDLRGLSKKLASGKSTVLRSQPAAAPIQAPSEELGLRRKLRLQQALLAATAIALLVLAFVHFRETLPEKQVRKFALTPEGFQSIEARAAISPSGEYITYSAGKPEMSLWVRPLDQESPRRLEGTEGARRPFWSPDSEFIGFVAGRILKRVPVSGGPTADLCRLPGSGRFFLGAWRPDGESIIFASQNPTRLFEVSVRGGEPRLIVDRVPSEEAVWASSPQFLSDRILLYRVSGGTPSVGESLVARDMETGEEQEWPVPAGAFVYSPTGHILYQLHSRFTGDLWALPFSSDPLGPSGDSFPIANNAGWPSVSDDAVLVYRQEGAPQTIRVRIVDRSGEEINDTDRRWRLGWHPTFSPGGKRLIVAVSNADTEDIWLYDLINRNWTRLAGDPSIETFPVWAPDGERVSFSSTQGSTDIGIYIQSAEPGEAQILLDAPGSEIVTDWNRATDRILYYRVETDERSRDLWYLEPDGRGGYDPKLFLSESFNQRAGAFSPDGRWVAYVSDQEGPNEVYVRKFPEGTPVHKVSRRGGEAPRWRSDGKELYYVEGQTVVAVDVNLEKEFSFGAPRPLFSDPSFLDDPLFRRYDVAPDGQTFAVISYAPEALASPAVIRVVENWFEEYRDRQQE